MINKILVAVVAIETVTILASSLFFFGVIYPDTQRRGAEIDVSVNNNKQKACMVTVVDKEVNRKVAFYRYVISKDNTCPERPQDLYISKSEYIEELKNNNGWGVFDDHFIYPDMIKPDISRQSQSKSSTISSSSI